jgi:hypothetical protein
VTAWSPVDLLPGLYVGLVGALCAALLRRWFDPLPGRVLAVFGLVLLPLFGSVLFGGGILLPLDNLRGHAPFTALEPTEPHGNILQGDLLQLILPSALAVREGWSEGRWPLWNRRVGAGMPLLADPQAQALQPFVLLAYPLPPSRAAGVAAALRVLAALAFTFLWLRRQQLSVGPALAGALAYGLGGFVLLWVGWPIANTAAWLPGVLWALARLDEVGGRRDLGLLAAMLLGLLLSGHPETELYAMAVAGAFLLGRLLRRPPGSRGQLLRRVFVAAALAGALAAPALLPAAELLPQSLRAARLRAPETLAPEPAFAAGLAPRLLPIAAPNAYGNSRFVDYWGLTNTNEDASGFVSTTTLLAALLALFAGLGRRLPGEHTALLLVGVALLFLARPPGLAHVLQLLPIGAGLGSRRLLLVVALGIAFLGAATLERVLRGELWARAEGSGAGAAGIIPTPQRLRRDEPRARSVGRSIFIVGFAAILAVAAALLAWGYLAHADPQDPARLAVLRFGWLRWQLRFLAVSSLALLAGLYWRRLRPLVAWVFVLCIAAELTLAHRPANPPMPRRLYLPQTFALRTLQYQIGIRAVEGYRMAALGNALPPNLASLYRLADARVYNPMAPQAYAELTRPITTGWWGELPQYGAPAHPLYRRLGIRFLLTRPGRKVPNAYQRIYAGDDAWVWELPGARPILDLGDTALAAPAARGSLRIVHLAAQSIAARVQLAAPGVLSSTLFQDGGWALLADGRPAPTGREAGALLEAALPAGRYRIDLLYRPASFRTGILLAALGLALAAAVLVPPPRRTAAAT